MNNKIPRLIGITGRKFNGKDTLCNIIVDIISKEDVKIKKIAFAGALKEACKCIFGFTNEQLYGNKKEEFDEFWKTTPRRILQFVGTDLFREQISNEIPHVGKEIWIAVVKKQILEEWNNNPDTVFIITDLRFENEFNMIKNMNGTTIRIERSSIDSIDMHSSEMEISNMKVDHIVKNDKTIDDLRHEFIKLNIIKQ